MEHAVFYPSADGSPAFRRVASLDEAVRFVEHLRNLEGVTEFSVHRLTQVPVAFRAYYRVEVPADEAPAADEAPVEQAEPQPVVDAAPVAEVPAPAEPADAEPAPAPAAAESGEPSEQDEPAAASADGDGRKSLSFFAR
jgi:hypothetical protein